MTTLDIDHARTHRTGIVLMTLSAVVFSSAGLFTKGVEAPAWDVVFWRGLFAAIATTAFIAGRKRMRAEFLEMGGPGLAVAIIGASGMAAFLSAFKQTDIANVALIYAAVPLVAAMMAWLWVGERLGRWVMIGCGLSFAGVGLIVGGSIGGLNLRGDLLAAYMTLVMAGVMVIYRRYPDTPGAGPVVLSSIILLPISAFLGAPLETALHEIWILAAFGLVFALASVTLNEGAKRLPSGQAGLLSTMEAPLAPVLAWMILAEVPAWATVFGGCLILLGVLAGQRSGSR